MRSAAALGARWPSIDYVVPDTGLACALLAWRSLVPARELG